ncbi:hypothetical protein HGRIS_012802 [Hohenbuehelia grisea]|uniref:CUE domain-containing protein n=1 Tax=Hohenbuehelia grisea TaxID=104357 RepID=A0ABR3ITL7_9AGAR
MTNTVNSLLPYPATSTRKALPPSKLSTLHKTISSSLSQVLALPPPKRDIEASRKFVSTYAKDAAQQELEALIWGLTSTRLSSDERNIRSNVLRLAEKLAMSTEGIELQTLLDLAVVYSRTNTASMRSLLITASKLRSHIATVERQLVDAITQLLSLHNRSGGAIAPSGGAPGLYQLRKTAHVLASFIHASPPEFVRPFARSKSFLLALASTYDRSLSQIIQSYGGAQTILSQIDSSGSQRELDDWERIWLETKVDLMDTFHIVFRTLVDDMTRAQGAQLAAEAERTFDIIFALIEQHQPPRTASSSTPSTPFLNRSLLHDYQRTYDLSRMLSSAMRTASERDARLDLLDSALQELERSESDKGGTNGKDPGALKLLLRSSGLPYRSAPVRATQSNGKGKAKEPSPTRAAESHIDAAQLARQISYIQDMLPHIPDSHIRALLLARDYPFYDNVERVVEALLDGSAPSEAELAPSGPKLNTVIDVNERRNIFDDEEIDLNNVRFGKQAHDTSTSLHDRSYIESVKADILRRAEAMSSDEDEEDEGAVTGNGKPKAIIVAYEDELEGLDSPVKVIGDGEASSDSDEDDGEADGQDEKQKQGPETILELAYIQDPNLFNRDAATRRSKARADLKACTGL